MKTCADCNHMRNKIPVVDGVILYRKSIAHCELSLITKVDGNIKKFCYGFRRHHKDMWYSGAVVYKEWIQARHCEKFKEA